MRRHALLSFKHILTIVGSRLPRRCLFLIQAAVNYMNHGRWMRDRGLFFEERVRDKEQVWATVANRVRNQRVLYLEFGVDRGDSMRYWSTNLTHPEALLHGFDSFEGLPESGGPWVKGQFDTGGEIPIIEDPRVHFFKGWFDEVLPTYSVPPHDVLIMNMDADLYSSTIYVLRRLRPYMRPGTFVYLDDMNQPEHVQRAFDEFLRESELEFRPVSADKSLAWVFLECVGSRVSAV